MGNSSLAIKEKGEISAKVKHELERYGIKNYSGSQPKVLTFEKGQYICLEGVPMDYLYFMVSGKARAHINIPDGKPLLVGFHIGRGIIGDVELLEDGIANRSIMALTDVTCIGLPMDQAMKNLRNDLGFMQFAAAQLAGKFEARSRKHSLSVLLNLEARLCSYILMTCEEDRFDGNLSEVAGLIGTSYRHLLRTLDALRKDGILEKSGKGYKIKDSMELEKRAMDYYSV